MIFLAAPVSMLALSIVSTGCSSASPASSGSDSNAEKSDSSAPASGGDTPASGGGGGGANCATVVVTNYDTSCTQDSDCVAAPAGGNTCDPCHAGSGDFVCKLSGVNAKDSARYASDLSAALQSIEGTSTYQQCVIASCPAGDLAPKCVDNQCKVTPSAVANGDD
jgi:hypothetical protein